MAVLKLSKTLVFFLRKSGEYSKRYGQGSVFTTDPWKKDPCPYLFQYSLDILKKKTKVLDIFQTDKKCWKKINKTKSSGYVDKDMFSWNKQIPITAA